MLVVQFLDLGSYHLWDSQYLVQILLLFAVFLYRTDSELWPIEYDQQRVLNKRPGQMHWDINIVTDFTYPVPTFIKFYLPSESRTCSLIGDYHNNTVGYVVCNTIPSNAYINRMMTSMVFNNVTASSFSHYASSGIERDIAGLQCMRFFIRISEQERDVRISNLTATPCPKLSLASLLYPHPNFMLVQLYGLPLQEDPIDNASCPTFTNLYVLHLQNNGLRSAPFSSCPAYFSKLEYVLLENQQLRLDDKPMFTFPGGLFYLSLHRCSLHNLPILTFDGLIRLQFLDISNNYISSLEKGVFHDLISLRVLRINNNALTVLDMSVFRRLNALQYLYLNRNHLTNIDGEVAILPSLLVINLSYNKLSAVRNNSFRDSPMLAIIYVIHNNISNIEPEAFFNMTSLKVFDASKNVLTYVNPCSWFDDGTGINYLILAYNEITNVEGLQCLSQLQVFNLFENKLSTIPHLSNVVNMTIFDLGNNAIHNVSGAEITPATRLGYLFLDGNKILRQGVFINSNSIKMLDLKMNKITHIPEFCFRGLEYLEKLNLSYNYVKYIGAFAFPMHLKELGLYGNKLSDLLSIYQTLPQLLALEIGNNNLTQPNQLNGYLPSVMYLDISDNPLQNLSLQLCKKMPNLQDIILENLGIGRNGDINRNLFGTFGQNCGFWHHVSLARNLINGMYAYLITLNGVSGSVDYSHNPLTSITPMSSRSASILRFLYYNNCSIKSIAPMAFQYMPTLTNVELKGNHIKYFPQMSQRDIDYDLQNNPIVCSCHLRWLHGHPKRRNYLFTTCTDPVNGSVEVFDHLPPDRLLCQHEINCAQGCVCFGVNTSTVTIVNCSSRSFTAIPLSLSSEAGVIYLDHNHVGKPHFPSGMEKMAASQLFLQNSEINFLEQDTFAAFHSLQLIDLSQNELETLNMDIFHSLHDLRKLLLHGNRIHQIYGGVAGYDLSLETITLQGNELDAIPPILEKTVDSTSFTNLTLAGNPWECAACAGAILRKWLAQYAGFVSDAADIHCHGSHLPVLDINMDTLEYAQCVNATHTLTNTRWGITAGLTVTFVLILISLVLSYRFRDHILVFLYNNFDFLKRRRLELDVLYDVRVIYDETDERVRQWVVGELLQILETEWGHDVFLVDRDMLAGGNHAEEIAQSIRQSRRTLVVVSQNFVDNEWLQFAYQAAFQFQIENNLHRVLVVAWEPVEIDKMEHNIKIYFETKQVMCRKSRRFWPVLKSKLPLGREHIRQNPDNMQLNLLHNDTD